MPSIPLNPADIITDDSLPAYPIQVLPKQAVTDEDVAKGTPVRIAARQKVQTVFDAMVSEQRSIKRDIQSKWANLSDDDRLVQQRILDTFNRNRVYLDLFNYIKSELVWWNNNLELSPRSVNTHDINYDETVLKKQIALENSLRMAITTAQTQSESEEEADAKKREVLRNKTLYDDIWDTFNVLSSWLFWTIYVLIGIRCASFAANQYLYKPLPYRVLVFIYVFIFCPIFAPYYLWKVIESFIWKTELPLYEGLFPINPYDPSEPLTFNRRIFGYADTPKLNQWMINQREKETKSKADMVISKDLKAQIVQEHSV
jgi:hypothetical protein